MSLVLVINSGSSSLKFGVFDGQERTILSGGAQGIGNDHASLEVLGSGGETLYADKEQYGSQGDALRKIAEQIRSSGTEPPVAVGHRIVHGGPTLVEHQIVTPAVLKTLRHDVHFAPLHIPPAIALIEEVEKLYPGIPQFACFDTAFHQTMPEAAWRMPLPAQYSAEGVRRYGFHGLSYESIVEALGANVPHRLVVAHLGNGASLAAIRDGKSIDTSMGMTPTGGIPMGTRPGDLDPGILLFLMRKHWLNADQLEEVLNRKSGLAGLSGISSDMREIEEAAAADSHEAALAIEIFCRAIAKTIAAYAVVLGGLDLLVFTGGIGQHSVGTRASVCRQLEPVLGLKLNGDANRSNGDAISAPGSRCEVRIMAAEEELQIARHCRRLLAR